MVSDRRLVSANLSSHMDWHVIRDIVMLLAAALAMGLVFESLRQSAIVGWIVAGTLIGPGVLGWVGGEELTELAELGVALLMFTVGLELSWREVRGFGASAVGAGVLQILATGAAVALVAMAIGLDWRAALVLGAIVSMSSTATVLRVFQDRAEVDSVHGRLALGVLLLQDLAVVPMVLLVTFLGEDGGLTDVVQALTLATGKAALLVVLFVVLGGTVAPRLFDFTALTHNRELPVILAVAAWLASTWAAHALGLSPALGAFVAGVALAGSPFARQVRADMAPFRIAFVTLFFASLGLLADWRWLVDWRNVQAVAVLVLAIVLGKAFFVWLALSPFGAPNRSILAAGFSLGQIGEFSFILAAIARHNGILDERLFQLVVSASLITLVLTPPVAGGSLRLAAAIERRMVRWGIWRPAPLAEDVASTPLRGHAIVVGHGPAGQGVVEALHRAGIMPAIVDLNPRSIAEVRARGVLAVVGDASRRETLEHLDVEKARVVVVTIPTHGSAVRVIEEVKALAPDVPIVARVRYHLFEQTIVEAGATVAVDEEQAVGRLLGEESLKAAGVSVPG